MRELYINGKLIDLEPSEPIACTYQRNDIGDLKDRQADYTNEFNLPLTKNNQIILGNPEVLQTQSVKAYRKNTARLLQDGIEIISNGVAIIGSSTIEGFVSVTVYSGIFDLFARLGDKTLKDVDFEDLSHIWSNAFAVSAKDNLTGVVYPLIKTEVADISDSTWNIANQVPSVFVRTIFEKIINQAGYSISGNFFLTSQYQNMIMPMLDTFERDEKWIKDRSALAGLSQEGFPDTVSVGSGSTGGEDGDKGGVGVGYYSSFDLRQFPLTKDFGYYQIFDQPQPGGALVVIETLRLSDGAKDNFKAPAWAYQADVAMFLNIDIRLVMEITTPTGGDCYIKFSARKSGIEVATSLFERNFVSGGEKVVPHNFGVQLAAGDTLTFFFEFVKSGGAGQPNVFFYWERSTVKFTPSKAIPTDSILDIRSIILPIKQKDFLKSILQMFGISIQNDNYADVLRFATFNEIAEKKPLDWSDKLDVSKEIEVTYRFDNYAQKNIFKYGKNAKETEIGNGDFLIDDETLEVDTIVVDIPFAGSIEGNLFPELFKVADVPIINAAGVRQKVEPRLLMIQRGQVWNGLRIVDGINPEFVLAGTTYPYAYFTKDGKEGLDFGKDLIPKYYGYLIDAFNRCKIVTCYLNLTPIDIQNLDFFTPIYIEYFNARFYINKIEDYTGYGSTKCELVRL